MVNVGSFSFFFGVVLAYSLITLSRVEKALARDNNVKCTKILTKTLPVSVVQTGYDAAQNRDAALNRNYVSAKRTDNGDFYVPKRSLVLVSKEYQKIMDPKTGQFLKDKADWVPIKVLSTPPENTGLQKTTIAPIKSIAKNPALQTQAKKEDVGFIKTADLEKSGKQGDDFVFIVKQDSELFKKLDSNADLKNLAPFALKFAKNKDGEYFMNKCCKLVDGNEKCFNNPIFQILNVRGSKVGVLAEKQFDLDCFSCISDFYSQIVPIEKNNLDSIRSILSHPNLGLPTGSSSIKKLASIIDLNFVDSRGLVQIPVKGEFVNANTNLTGPFGSQHYIPEATNADIYMKPLSACGFMQILKAWEKSGAGEKIIFGDASHAYYKEQAKVPGMLPTHNNHPWPHTTHTQGECIDIATDKLNDTNLETFMKLVAKAGYNASQCFTDRRKISSKGICQFDSAHQKHTHICFPEKVGNAVNNTLQKACQEGVTP